MKRFKIVLGGHALYILLTGLWPLFQIKSFMAVTGPKTDVWLVKTVAALLIVISLTMLSHLIDKREKLSAVLLGAGMAVALIAIDLYYSISNTISDIYLVDAALESFFLLCWIYIAIVGVQKKRVQGKE